MDSAERIPAKQDKAPEQQPEPAVTPNESEAQTTEPDVVLNLPDYGLEL